MAKRLKPNTTQADRIIALCGGVRPTARLEGIPFTTVSSWRKRGWVPAEHQQELINKAFKAGITLLPTDFLQYPPLSPRRRSRAKKKA